MDNGKSETVSGNISPLNEKVVLLSSELRKATEELNSIRKSYYYLDNNYVELQKDFKLLLQWRDKNIEHLNNIIKKLKNKIVELENQNKELLTQKENIDTVLHNTQTQLKEELKIKGSACCLDEDCAIIKIIKELK